MQALPRVALAVSLVHLACAAMPAQAVEIARVDVRGLDEVMTDNVNTTLSLTDAVGDDVSDRRLEYLLKEAEQEVRDALEPFGYYDPVIRVTRTGDVVVVDVQPGEPVRVRARTIAVRGPGGEEEVVQEDVGRFEPEIGEVFSHPVYESSKGRVSRRLAERGYFDADFESRRVEVTRATRAADIDLVWTSGERYRMGEATFVQTPRPVVYVALLR
jgi:translocation and assembly module TamA